MNVSTIDILWVLASAGLVFLMQAGFLCLESGLTRTKNNINVAIKNLADFSITTILFWAFGYGLMFGASTNEWFSTADWALEFSIDDAWVFAFFIFQVMFCGAAVTILSGAVAERIRYRSYVAVTIVVAGLIYPLFGHWAWNGLQTGELNGWLGVAGFYDFAGSTVVHSVGGWAALALLIIIGPREGRFPADSPPAKIPASNLPLAVLGVLLLWLGWFGFNGGSTLGIELTENANQVIRVLSNTILAGSMGMVSALAVGWVIRGQPEVDLLMNGALGGLVGITAGASVLGTSEAVLVGAISGVLMLAVHYLLEFFRIDDAVGAIPVHLGCGIWGTLAVGIWGDLEIIGTGLSRSEQIAVQLMGIGVAGAWAFGVTFVFFYLLNKFMPLRVSQEQERIGLNMAEHNARNDLYDLLSVIDRQAETQDLSIRVPEEPFTEVGLIARRYNNVMDSLEKALATTEATFRTAMDGIITFSQATFTIHSLNPAAEGIFSYGHSDLKGEPITLVFDEGWSLDGLQVEQMIHIAARDNIHYETVGRRRDGTTFPLEFTVTQDMVGDETLYIGFFRDITERHAAAEALQTAKDVAEEANRTKSAFLANMSHELRTPLNAIIGYTDLILGKTYGDISPLQSDRLQRVYDNGRHLLGLINDLLDLSKIEAGKMELYIERFRVIEAVNVVTSAIRPIVEKNNNKLVVTISEEVDLVKADRTKLQQVLLNLLSNAAKFTENGKISLHIEAYLKTDSESDQNAVQKKPERWIRYRVSDNGIGMTPEQLEAVFDEFVQADPSTTRKYGGTGLGLSISRRFCRVMGGDIVAESEQGVGSTFMVELPQNVKTPENIPTRRDTSEIVPPDLVMKAPQDAPQILIIDDDPIMREVLGHYLNQQNFKVISAADGKTGLELAREHKPDVITLDVMMPEMDGWSVLSSLKNDPELNTIPVIMITMLDDKSIGYKLGASDFLTKPVQPERLGYLLNKYRCSKIPCPILIIEDNPNIRIMLRDILQESGMWTIIEAENGEDGLQKALEYNPSVILLDLMMPVMDGFEFLEARRNHSTINTTPVIVITAADLSTEDRQRLYGSVQNIIQKGNYTRDELLEEVKQLVLDHTIL